MQYLVAGIIIGAFIGIIIGYGCGYKDATRYYYLGKTKK